MKNLCQALAENDQQALKTLVNNHLATFNMQEGKETLFKKLAQWLQGHDCIEYVKEQPGEIRIRIPVKVFVLKLKNETHERNLDIQLFPEGYKFRP